MAIGTLANADLRLLRVFMAVVRCGGYSAAQAELNIGLATISAHMKSLEGRLGCRLCQRGRTGFKLTDEGKIVYEEAQLLISAIERFESLSQALEKELAGKLKLGVVDGTTSSQRTLISDTIRAFNKRKNHVLIEIHIESRQLLEKGVLDGSLDLAIGPFATNYVGLEVVPLYEEHHALYCGVGHPLFERRDPVQYDELGECVITTRGHALTDDRERIGSMQVRAVVYNLEAQLALILSSGYIGYLPTQYAEPWIAEHRLRKLDVESTEYNSQHLLIHKPENALTVQAKTFINDLLTVTGHKR